MKKFITLNEFENPSISSLQEEKGKIYLNKKAFDYREVVDEDRCDWCGEKASITDGTYVYCSKLCQQLFFDNAYEAIDRCIKNLLDK